MTTRIAAAPKPMLSVIDGVLLLAGMVIGAGIFRLPSLVAGNTSGLTEYFFVWILGGIVSLSGALVYAELAARFPEAGGEYRFLDRGLGSGPAFVFAWSRMTVIQTGAIAAVAFIFGDYASQVIPLGTHGSTIWAVVCVLSLTALNIAGTMPSKTTHKVAQILVIGALVLIGAAGMIADAPAPAASAASATVGGTSFGLAMVFVLFTYGGWNEAAYLGGEVRDARRNMIKVLVIGILLITALYLFVNIGYVGALGLEGIRQSRVVAADMMRAVAGDRAAMIIALVICTAAFTTINAAIFTGARTTWAMGRDFPAFAKLGVWRNSGSTPINALLLQALITLALIAAGSRTQDGFQAMVAYTAPVFWTFFFLTGMTLFVFRRRGGEAPSFRTPLYPVVPAVFCAMCLYMLYSSIDYIRNPAPWAPKFGEMVAAGLVVMAIGIPLYFFSRRGRGAGG